MNDKEHKLPGWETKRVHIEKIMSLETDKESNSIFKFRYNSTHVWSGLNFLILVKKMYKQHFCAIVYVCFCLRRFKFNYLLAKLVSITVKARVKTLF